MLKISFLLGGIYMKYKDLEKEGWVNFEYCEDKNKEISE